MMLQAPSQDSINCRCCGLVFFPSPAGGGAGRPRVGAWDGSRHPLGEPAPPPPPLEEDRGAALPALGSRGRPGTLDRTPLLSGQLQAEGGGGSSRP